MNEAKKLTIQMTIFCTIIFVLLSTIIIKEKSTTLFLPKIENSLNKYITENYNELDLEKTEVTIKDNEYKIKLMNKTNNNLYFYITYSKKTITDTYQKDYIEGKSIITYLNKKLQDNISKKTKQNYKITINNTYDNFSNKIKKQILKEENLESLKIYTLEAEITSKLDNVLIANEINNLINNLEAKNITPKNYTIIINDLDKITKSIKINNITKNDDLNLIIDAIINKTETSILDNNKITYEFLN